MSSSNVRTGLDSSSDNYLLMSSMKSAPTFLNRNSTGIGLDKLTCNYHLTVAAVELKLFKTNQGGILHKRLG